MTKDIMKQYAQLKSQQMDIDAELKTLYPAVIEAMGEHKTISNGYGSFTKVIRRKFLFSQKLIKKEVKVREKIAEMKAKEIEDGASWNEDVSLRYDLPKIKVN